MSQTHTHTHTILSLYTRARACVCVCKLPASLFLTEATFINKIGNHIQ